ncbi:MAG: hypothetical protein K6E72_11925 [Saccharofermentans sp.]|nr:hypothetical protein [Saccharofermentans sp.]
MSVYEKEIKMKKIITIVLGLVLVLNVLTGCDQSAATSNSAPDISAAADKTIATEDTTIQASSSTTGTTTQATSYTGVSEIKTVNIDDYWISDTRFDLINYCRDQGATIKYRIYADDSHKSYTFCLPEELPSTGQEPLNVCMFFYFGVPHEFLTLECHIAPNDSYMISTETDTITCIGMSETDEDYTWVTIDDYGTHLALSTINNLPVMFEYIMVLPYNSPRQTVTETFKEHYPGWTTCA